MSLGDLRDYEVAFLLKAVRKGQLPTPLTRFALESIGKGTLFDRLGPLKGAPREAVLALLEYACQSGSGHTAPSQSAKSVPTLVWTAPEVAKTKARATTAVVLELFSQARAEVFIAGYEFDHGATLFEPLNEVMETAAVSTRIVLDVPAPPSAKVALDSYLALRARRFLDKNWPFSGAMPELYFYSKAVEPRSYASAHAKCAVVDRRHVMVGSANFTRRGHSRNLEVGVLLDDASFAETLLTQFEQLIESGQLAAMPTASLPKPTIPEAEAEEESAVSEEEFAAMAEELLVSAEARALFIELMKAGHDVPLVGEDIEGHNGSVLGSPELSWPSHRVALLLGTQSGSRRALESDGWRCFVLPITDADRFALAEALIREV
ncbi:MAG: DISARM system phospholipase D-like protein DrmC [Myxococcota bacterium]